MTNSKKIVYDENGEPYEMIPLNAGDEEEAPKRKGRKPKAEEGFAQMWTLELRRRRKEVSVGAFWLFTALVEQMDRKDGVVFYELDSLREALGIAHNSTVSGMVAELVMAGWVRRVRRSVVAVNPHLAWRGLSDDRGISMFRWNNHMPMRKVAR